MDTHGIVTPEAVVLDFEPAGVASRLFARLIDLAILMMAFGMAVNAMAVVLVATSETAAVVGVLILGFLALFGYPAVLEAFGRGRTLGKMAVGLRVLTVEGAPVRFRHTAVRSMMQLIDLVLTLGGAAIISAVLSPRGQRLGDVLAGTIVIRERRTSSLLAERAVLFPNPRGLDDLVGSIDPSPLDPGQASLVRGFLIRVTELDPTARASIAHRLSLRVADRLGQPIPAQVHPETWLACVAAALQRRSEELARASRPPPPSPLPQSSLATPPRSSLGAPPPLPGASRPDRPGRAWDPPS